MRCCLYGRIVLSCTRLCHSGTHHHGFRLHRGTAAVARQRAQAFAKARAARICAPARPRAHLSRGAVPGLRRGRPFGAAVPGRIRRRRRQRARHGHRRRGDRARLRRSGDGLYGRHLLRAQPRAHGVGGAEALLAAEIPRRQNQVLDLDVGGRCRLRHRRDAHDRRERRQRMGDRRPKTLGVHGRRQEQRHQSLCEDRYQGALPPGPVIVPGRQRHARADLAQARHARPPRHRHL